MTETIAQIAEREAAEAEAEAPDDTADEPSDQLDPEAEVETEAEVAPQPNDRAAEQREEKLEREDERHAKRVAEIMGEHATDLAPCMLCLTRGFVHTAAAGHYEDEHIAAVKAQLGEGTLGDYEDADDATRCEACKGKGQRRTHSEVPGQELKPCRVCNGSGWNTVTLPIEVPSLEQLMATPAPQFAPLPSPAGIPDGWGRSPGHPHYGQHPDLVGRQPANGGVAA